MSAVDDEFSKFQQNSGYVAAFPHATPGYIPSPLQSPYLTSPLAHMNPAMMTSLFPAAAASMTSPVTSAEAALVNTTDSSRSAAQAAAAAIQMQAALLHPAGHMSVPNQFQQHHLQAAPQPHQLHLTHQAHKAKSADRVEVGNTIFYQAL